MATKTPAQPDVAIHPGEILADELAARRMTQGALARLMGRPLQAVNEIINGKKAITAETALQLERVLQTPAQVWMNLQAQYELTRARLAAAGPRRRARAAGGGRAVARGAGRAVGGSVQAGRGVGRVASGFRRNREP